MPRTCSSSPLHQNTPIHNDLLRPELPRKDGCVIEEHKGKDDSGSGLSLSGGCQGIEIPELLSYSLISSTLNPVLSATFLDEPFPRKI